MRVVNNIWNKALLTYKKVTHGENLVIAGRVCIHGRKSGIVIGNNCTIYSNESVNPTSGVNHSHLVVGPKGELIIGDNVGMSHVNITAYDSIVIENDVLIGSGVKVWDTDFHSLEYNARREKHLGKTAPIRIKQGAFIGACSIILKGVTVGAHSVVGAGSVVTKNIPDSEVWAGNPAKCIRKL